MVRTAWVFLLCALGILGWQVRPASAEWFGDLYLGAALTGSRDVDAGSAGMFRNVGFDTSGVVGGRAGYWFEDTDYLAVALDVVHFRPDVGSQTGRSDQGPARFAKLDLTVTAVSIDLMLRYPLWRDENFPKGRLQPYFLVGPLVGITKADDTSNFGPPNNQSHLASSAGFNVGVGLLWQFHRHLGLFGEYRYVQFSPTFKFDPAGDVKFNVNSHLLAGGISFRF